MSELRCRRVCALAWVLAGMCWMVQFFLPFTAHGPMSVASPFDTARFAVSGLMSATVPMWIAGALVLLPITGVMITALAVTAPFSAPVVACGVIGVVTAIAVGVVSTPDGFRSWGPGAWLVSGGIVFVIIATFLGRGSVSQLQESS